MQAVHFKTIRQFKLQGSANNTNKACFNLKQRGKKASTDLC